MPRIVGDLFNASKYSLDIEMAVRYEWRGTSQNAWPSVSGLTSPGQQRKGLRAARCSRSDLRKTARLGDSDGRRSGAVQRAGGLALARLNCIH